MMFWQPKSALEPIQLWGGVYGVERGETVVAYHGDDLAPMRHKQGDHVWRMRDDHWVPVTDLTIERAVLAQAATAAVSVPEPAPVMLHVVADKPHHQAMLDAIYKRRDEGELVIVEGNHIVLEHGASRKGLALEAGWARASDVDGTVAARRMKRWFKKVGITVL